MAKLVGAPLSYGGLRWDRPQVFAQRRRAEEKHKKKDSKIFSKNFPFLESFSYQ